MVDALCLDVIVSWLPSRFFFMWDYTMFFFPRKLGHHSTLTELLFSQLSLPYRPSYDLKSSTQVRSQVAYTLLTYTTDR